MSPQDIRNLGTVEMLSFYVRNRPFVILKILQDNLLKQSINPCVQHITMWSYGWWLNAAS